jgi:hypothetical protein
MKKFKKNLPVSAVKKLKAKKLRRLVLRTGSPAQNRVFANQLWSRS